MTRDQDPQLQRSLDDEAIGLLIRDVADAWTMPAVRLDAPGWRERVRGRRARLVDAGRSGLGRAAQAATAAVALTVAAALVAVVITHPPTQPAGSPNATPGASSGPTSPVVRSTPLPKVQLNGDTPQPSRLLVGTEKGDFALADLEKGVLSEGLAGADWPSAATVRSDGTIACLCAYTRERLGSYPSRIEVRLRTFTADGTPVLDEPVETFVGNTDVRDQVPSMESVRVEMSFDPGGRYGYVGWSLRGTGPAQAWHAGILSVDLTSGATVGAQALPDLTTGEGQEHRLVSAQRIAGFDATGRAIVGQSWWQWATGNTDTLPWKYGSTTFRGSVVDGAWSEFAEMPASAVCGDELEGAGAIPGGGTWLLCASANSGDLGLRRLNAADALIGGEGFARDVSVDGKLTVLNADGTVLYAWNPATSTMTRIDLASGDRIDRTVVPPAASRNPLAAFGDWLAPSASAKSILRGAIVPSPDGTRVYVLGVQPGADSHELSGSAGVIVLDAANLAVIDRWPPTADFVSLTLSPDGRFLYASGMPGIDATGRRLAQGASITVFDTSDGSIRLIAGELGSDLLTFPSAVAR